MITFLTILFFILALFVNSNWAVVMVLLIIAFNAITLYQGFKGRKSDPIEWWKRIIVNGGIATLSVIILVWARIR